ncbi:MAG: hypothetical protein AAF654_07045 [Myxococcota bacterium]
MIGCTTLVAALSTASAAVDPLEPLALVLTKALAYDQRLVERDSALIFIVKSEDSDRVSAAFEKLPTRRILGKSLSVRVLTSSDAGIVDGEIKSGRPTFVLLTPATTDESVASYVRSCDRHQVPCIALKAEHARAGASLGVSYRDKRPKLFANYGAMQTQKSRFSSDLLRLAVRVD